MCHHCSKRTEQRLALTVDGEEEIHLPETPDFEGADFTEDVKYFVTVCESCRNPSVYGVMMVDVEDPLREARVLWPRPPEPLAPLVERDPPRRPMTPQEILRLTNRFIGVTDGYLGDFNYRTHAEFYPEFCNLEIDPNDWEGTTRERFIAILSSVAPEDQAKVLRGVVERFPIGEGPATRAPELRQEILSMAVRLAGGTDLDDLTPRLASGVVRQALADAATLLNTSGAPRAVDRVCMALHAYLIAICRSADMAIEDDASIVALFKKVRQEHPAFASDGPRKQDMNKILNASASILDAMQPVRNRASAAHPNEVLLGDSEAHLVINVSRTLLLYLDSKLAD